MSAYRIRYGDTLSGIARRYGTSVSALMQANPSIQSARLIHAGKTLSIPGRRDDFVAAHQRAQHQRAQPQLRSGSAYDAAPRTAGTSQPLDLARQYMGWNARDLKVSSNAVGRAMADWVPNNVNCANFVSATLIAAGQLRPGQGHAAVRGLMANLDRDPNFRRVSLANAKPGDVVSMRTRGGHHVALFAGWKNGRPQFIGSNNVNADGSQRISYLRSQYPIIAVHQYRG